MKNLTRRKFIHTSLLGAAGLSMFPFVKGCAAPSDQIRLGVIGLGRQAISLINGFHMNPGVKVVAGADVYGRKRQRFEMLIREYQEAAEYENIEVWSTENYQDMLEDDNIDVIVIASPDHWHAIQAIEACRAGKDIYLEKPVTLTIREGIEVVNAVREHNIILGVGSQQRSDPNFQHAVKLVRENRLGDLAKVNAWVGGPAVPYDLPEEEVPEDLNWDKWLGPNQYVHYNNELNPPISLDPVQNEQFWGGWRWYKETGGGLLTDWGAHMFDVVQWALDKDDSGPVEVIPAGHSGTDYIDFVYENGLVMSNAPFTDDGMQGVRFEGSDGWIEVHRGIFRASDDELMPPVPEAADDEDVEYEQASPHLVDFIGSVRSRRDPIAPIEAGHRTGTIGTLGNIATVLDRPLKWNPDTETFVDDAEADGHLHRDYRDGYSL